MDCFDLPDGLSHCITYATRWLELLYAILSLGTLSAIGILVLFHRRQKKDINRLTKNFEDIRSEKQRVEERLRDAHQELGATRYQLNVCETALKSGSDDKENQLSGALSAITLLESY
jgi:hypothetical protein